METVHPEVKDAFRTVLADIIKDKVFFVRVGAQVEAQVYFNDFQVYRFLSPNMPDALDKMQAVLCRLTSFAFAIYSRQQIQENLIGRPVWYREMPAIVRDFDGYQGRVRIVPDNAERVFPPEPWDDPSEPITNLGVWEDLLSDKIYWFRDREDV